LPGASCRVFRANSVLLSGPLLITAAVIVPLLTLILIALSEIVDQAQLLDTLRVISMAHPGQSAVVVTQLHTSWTIGSDRLGAPGDDVVFQFSRFHRSGKCNVRHFLTASSHGAAAT